MHFYLFFLRNQKLKQKIYTKQNFDKVLNPFNENELTP